MLRRLKRRLSLALAHYLRFYLRELERAERPARLAAILGSFQSCGHGCKLHGEHWDFVEAKRLTLGNNVQIGNRAYFFCAGGLIIGDNTHISRNVTIYTANHDYTGDYVPYSSRYDHKPVQIGRNVWIGMNVSICPGVTIGEGAIIAMGTTISRNIAPFSVVGSSPQRELKQRDAEAYRENLKAGRIGGISGVPVNPAEFHPSLLESSVAPLFVLGTGRSGTTTICDLLRQSPGTRAEHEPFIQLTSLSTRLAYGDITTSEASESLRMLFQHVTVAPETEHLVYADQKFWNLVPLIHELLPRARFLHLIRDGRDFVRSAVSRGWFGPEDADRNGIWGQTRLQGDRLDPAISSESWQGMSPFARASWYWALVNDRIEGDLAGLPPEVHLTIRLEELPAEVSRLFQFLGWQAPEPLQIPQSNVVAPPHRKQYAAIAREDFEADFLSHAKATHERFYGNRS